jgi:hypothetical protein
MRLTKARINKAIAHTRLRVEGRGGDGFFYFICADTGYKMGLNVDVCRLNQQPISTWIRDAEEARNSDIIEGIREYGVLPHDLGGFEG